MKTFVASVPFVSVVWLIIRGQESFDGFTVWSCMPVVLGFVASVVALNIGGALRVACMTFATVALCIPAVFHLAWQLDWAGTATGSSTSGVAFLFVPLWALIGAAVAGLVAGLMARYSARKEL